jgi:cytochrome c
VKPLSPAFLLRSLARACAVGATLASPAPAVHASEALARKYACTACHQADRKLVGPSWRDISAKYGNGSLTAEQLATAIRAGGSGKWGAVPMPAQSHVAPADLTAISVWILRAGKP